MENSTRKICSNCQYLRDFGIFDLGFRCMNVNNSPRKGDFLEVSKLDYTCTFFKAMDQFNPIEFDPIKDNKNREKHGISLGRAIDILKDLRIFQMVSTKDKWEDFSKVDFEELAIEKNTGNTDPLRGMVFGHIDGELYMFAYTFRHEIGDMKYRVISLRKANEKERQMYQEMQNLADEE
ncbi:MAG: hypothetical protein COW00_02295 [Bdellovibrio sp. CG12_big_fil_rev_8_21_14_0_65_39_13]|nr:MAG: hypothetical protein COW78_09680 [Bdellovibrio sp. CG22_combo_CG10-13_8_21_14_all_39_27]PIQ62077.1 MAG: hypothetical protein COW00_02295 [Bdellovibrio sp. CG12_big_fil_rev_8_21_14_0_65_39_13]PIR32385.1 MAG: hypothetical protein COV37_19980 [Bdellovibrio sp. CG11_big_fil_rev_8_21_14_0_20_39_38]